MTAEIISIGDELLIGQTVNTNASHLGEQLSMLGITVARITTVGDALPEILSAFRRAWREHAVVLVTGGLGPTHDDVTRAAVCSFFETPLVLAEDVLADIERMFARLQRPMLEPNRDQAMVPAAASVLRNANGTAPGYHVARDGKHFFVMPGVPYEMAGMFESGVAPVLRALADGHRAVCIIRTTGVPESVLASHLHGIHALLNGAGLAFLPSPLGVTIRLTVTGVERGPIEDHLARLRQFVYDAAGDCIFGEDATTLEEILGALLRERGMRVAVAESCTGGLLSDKITNVPGSSEYFERGVVTYSNESKVRLLSVDPSLIDAHGAVSSDVAKAMAEGVRLAANAGLGISTTGIAGPGGGSDAKPVGLVWIGLSDGREILAHRYLFGDNRLRTKQRAAQTALDLARRRLLGLPPHSPLTHQH